MSSLAFLMHVESRRREIGIVALVAQSVILPFAPRCGYLEGLTGLLVAGLVSLPLIVNSDDQARPLGILEKAIVMTGLGGLGMALDGAFYQSAYRGFSCIVYPAQSSLNGSILSMIFFCYIGCRLCVRSCDRQIFTRFIETSFCMLTMIAGMFSGELFLTSLLVDWWGQQIGSHWGMMTGMLVGNFVGIGAFDTLRKLKRHSDFGLNQL
jgi:hypothetical protein